MSYLSLVIPWIQCWGAKHAVLLLMKLSALRHNHTMTAGRGGAGTTCHEIRGGKNWLAIFICAKLNKRRLLPYSAYHHGVGEEEGTQCWWRWGGMGKRSFRAQGFYCLVREDVGVGEQRGTGESGGLGMGEEWQEGRHEGCWGRKKRKEERVTKRSKRRKWETRRQEVVGLKGVKKKIYAKDKLV